MNIIRPVIPSEDRYCIRLANGQGWQILAFHEMNSFVEKLATIMRLKICASNENPRLIFIEEEAGKNVWRQAASLLKTDAGEALTRQGWKDYDFHALRFYYHSYISDVIFSIGPQISHELTVLRMMLSLFPIYQRAQDTGGIPIHAALLEWKGIGVLLVAPGDTGKTTCCRRLLPPWSALCDDECLVVRDTQDRYLVHPFPTWSDHLWQRSKKSWNVQHYIPLSAIFFLEQAEKDEVLPAGEGRSTVLLTQSALQVCQRIWDRHNPEKIRPFRKKLFENACELAKTVPAYNLRFTLNGRFWEEMEKVIV